MTKAPSLLLVDDDEGQLDRLEAAVRASVGGTSIDIRRWQPSKQEESVRDQLASHLKDRPTLVVTDHDLTENGPAGLMGGAVISRCRAEAIPVGVYSRQLADELEEPDLFNFVFDSDPDLAGGAIANVVLGFHRLSELLVARDAASDQDSWSSTLARVLGHPEVANSFSLYSVRTGASHQGLVEHLTSQGDAESARCLLETYVLGHLLVNSILRYPGPLLSSRALCSYMAVSDECEAELATMFAGCAYEGPFSHTERFFWHKAVDDQLSQMADEDFDNDDALDRRTVISNHVKDAGTHPCNHCDGARGGFRCPYIDRTVCDLPECSVPTSSWIPQGAYLCRADKDYYDRLSPLLGL